MSYPLSPASWRAWPICMAFSWLADILRRLAAAGLMCGAGRPRSAVGRGDLADRALPVGHDNQFVLDLLDSRHVRHDLARTGLLPRVGDFSAKRGQSVPVFDVDLVSVEGGLFQSQRDVLGDLLVFRFLGRRTRAGVRVIRLPRKGSGRRETGSHRHDSQGQYPLPKPDASSALLNVRETREPGRWNDSRGYIDRSYRSDWINYSAFFGRIDRAAQMKWTHLAGFSEICRPARCRVQRSCCLRSADLRPVRRRVASWQPTAAFVILADDARQRDFCKVAAGISATQRRHRFGADRD